MEQTAFLEHAINQYGKATYNYAYRLTQNEADARDLTQEAFLRVYRAWRSFKPGTSFLSWIYRIVTNLHRDELRRRKGRYQEEIPEDHDSKNTVAAAPSQSSQSRNTSRVNSANQYQRRSLTWQTNSVRSYCSPTLKGTATKRSRRSLAAPSARCARAFTALVDSFVGFSIVI